MARASYNVNVRIGDLDVVKDAITALHAERDDARAKLAAFEKRTGPALGIAKELAKRAERAASLAISALDGQGSAHLPEIARDGTVAVCLEVQALVELFQAELAKWDQ